MRFVRSAITDWRTLARELAELSSRRAVLVAFFGVILVMGAVYLTTHVAAPRFFTHYEYAAELAPLPKRSTDAYGRAADPINIAIVGSRAELRTAMRMAGWVVADSLTRAAKIAIARSVLFNRPGSILMARWMWRSLLRATFPSRQRVCCLHQRR